MGTHFRNTLTRCNLRELAGTTGRGGQEPVQNRGDSSACNGTSHGALFRWVGGKQRIVHRLVELLPDDFYQRTYVEPFLGAASLFMRMRPKRAILADVNDHLINTYLFIRDNPDGVARNLRKFIRHDDASFYYSLRETYNRNQWSAAQSARFIYLNRTCFNGIFRVNRRGEFNVPYGGNRKSPRFPTTHALHACAAVLAGTRLLCESYEITLARLPKKSFVYLDPPYPPLNGTSFFTHYTKDRFSTHDQHCLAEVVQSLDRRSIPFLMTNADTQLIRTLYRNFELVGIDATRWVTCKSKKHQVKEVVIRNY